MVPNVMGLPDCGSRFIRKRLAALQVISDWNYDGAHFCSDELKDLEDSENPLDPANHIHYLIKRFLYEHSRFDRCEIQAYLNLYSFVFNPPYDKLGKVDYLLD